MKSSIAFLFALLLSANAFADGALKTKIQEIKTAYPDLTNQQIVDITATYTNIILGSEAEEVAEPTQAYNHLRMNPSLVPQQPFNELYITKSFSKSNIANLIEFAQDAESIVASTAGEVVGQVFFKTMELKEKHPTLSNDTIAGAFTILGAE